jgi:NAD(P)-dependent dehydrogenase (short-subunit alcohol dehydrogenase family)
LDITDNDSIQAAVNVIENEFGYLTVLVNNAAISNAGKSGRTMQEILGESLDNYGKILHLSFSMLKSEKNFYI